ncbi:MAG: hypothetical protein K5851_07985 [Lachnospiraceae bacterium]|nr:hypothetical protein [Lachnospiraceae bacterium]
MVLKVLICDSDESYLDALVKFLISSDVKMNIACYSDVNAFKKGSGIFDVKLMTEEYIAVDNDSIAAKEKIQLLDSKDLPLEGIEHLYKFQSMDTFLDKLVEAVLKKSIKVKNDGGARLVGVMSPSHHNLTLPFSMVYAKLCRQYGRVLFVDLGDDMSFLNIDTTDKYNLIDYIYEIQAGKKDIQIENYIENYEGISCMLPVVDPEELWEITSDDWEELIVNLRKSEFDVVVLMFGEFNRDFFEVMHLLDDLMLVGGKDAYSTACTKKFKDYILAKGLMIEPQEVVLTKKLCEQFTGYDVEKILQGNLNEWIGGIKRDQIKFARG